ncbi:MAG: polysaccharide biosynthesis tyrosine autokinase [Bacteroidota bacterium]
MANYKPDIGYGYNYSDYSLTNKEETINIMMFVKMLLKKWWVFAITLPIFLGIGVYIVMSTLKTYESRASIMVTNGNMVQASSLNNDRGGAIPMITMAKNMPDEIAYLRSFNLLNKVMERLDFEVVYKQQEGFKIKDKYKDTKYPYTVEMDESHVQLATTLFYIDILSDQKYKVYTGELEAYSTYKKGAIPEEDMITTIKQPYSFEQEGQFGVPLETDKFRFTLFLNKQGKIEEGDTYMFSYVPNSAWAKYYMNTVQIAKIPDGNVLTFDVEGPTPVRDIDYLNALGDTYIESRLAQKNAFADGTIEFIESTLASVQQKADDAKKNAIDISSNTTGLSPENASQLNTLLNMEYTKRDELRLHVNYLEQNLKAIDSGLELSTLDPMSIKLNAPAVFNSILNLKELQQTLVETRLTGVTLETEIAQDKVDAAKRSLKGELEALLSVKKLEQKNNRNAIGRLSSQLKKIPGVTINQTLAGNQLEMNQSLVDFLNQELASAKISKSGTKPDAYFLDRASLKSPVPVSPKTGIILISAAALGLILPAAIIILLSLFDTNLRDEEHLKSITDIPVLSSILHTEEQESLLDPDFVMTPLAESFRYLNVNVDYLLNPNEDEKVIGVTSFVKGEGKTFTSTHLGVTMALSGKRTLMIGADIRRPQLYKRLGLDNSVGLTNFLMGRAGLEEIIKTTTTPNLYVITSGHKAANLTELLNSPMLPSLVDELKANFDYVIIDTPPVGLVSDYLLLAHTMDITLLVCRERYSKIDFVKQITEMRNNDKLSKIYYVLNDSRRKFAGYAKGKYGSKYEYGNEESKSTKIPNIFNGRKKTKSTVS